MGHLTRFWLDCEFDGYGGRLLSLALISQDGAEYYWATPDVLAVTNEWVRNNVVPVIDVPGARPTASDLIHGSLEGFLLTTTRLHGAHIIADWPDDVAYLCRAMLTGPGQRIATPPLTFEVVRFDAYPTTLNNAVQHNALWDARALRHWMECNPWASQ